MTWNLYIFVAGLKARDFACCFRPSARQPVHLFAASFRVIFSAIILLSHAIPGFHFGAVLEVDAWRAAGGNTSLERVWQRV